MVDAKGTREPIVVYDLRGFGKSDLPGAPEGLLPLAQPLHQHREFPLRLFRRHRVVATAIVDLRVA